MISPQGAISSGLCMENVKAQHVVIHLHINEEKDDARKIKKRRDRQSLWTNLFGLFRLHFPSTPRYNVKIDNGIQYEEQVHGRNGQ